MSDTSNSSVSVIARVRPGQGKAIVSLDGDDIVVGGEQRYTFTKCLGPDSTQVSVFDAAGRGVSDAALSGYNCTLFAYGQTGSGKTHTIYGPSDNKDGAQSGLLPRTLDYVFSQMRAREEASEGRLKYSVKVSFLEIYNERIYDLLDTSGGVEGLDIREHKTKGVFVEGLSEVAVGSVGEAHESVVRGLRARTTASTLANRESSRSHSVFSLQLESMEKVGATTTCRSSRFHLIDLAGSERQKVTGAAGERLKEACGINKSLSCLTSVIHALVDIAQGKQRFVPYRDSKLTMLLRDSLGGNSKTVVVANVAPTEDCFAETLSTLKFAQRAKLVKNTPMINEDTQGSLAALGAELKATKAQMAEWKALALSGGGGGGSLPSSSTSSSTASLPSLEAYKLGEGMLASWDKVLRESINTMPTSGSSESAGASGSISSSSTTLDTLPDPVLALTALSHTSKKLVGLIGDKATLPLTLTAAATAFERLVELEERHATAWASKEEADSNAGDLQAALDAMRGEKAQVEKQVEVLKGLVGAITAEWEATKAATAAATAAAAAGATPGAATATPTPTITASSVPTVTASSAPLTAPTSVEPTATNPSSMGGDSAATGSSKLLAPGFKVAGRRGSVTVETTASATATALLSTTIKATPQMSQLASSQRSTASSMCKTTFAAAAAATSTSSASANPSGMRRGSLSLTSSSTPLLNSTGTLPVRRGSISLSSGGSLLSKPSSTTTTTTTTNEGEISSQGGFTAPIGLRSDLAMLLTSFASATQASLEASLESRNAEVARLKERIARLESSAASSSLASSEDGTSSTSSGGGADPASTIHLSRASFHGLREELSRVTWELAGLRREVYDKCEPGVGEKARAAMAVEQGEWGVIKAELQSKCASAWEELEAVKAAGRKELEEAHERESELAASHASLEATLEVESERRRGVEERVVGLEGALRKAEAEVEVLRGSLGDGVGERGKLAARLEQEREGRAKAEAAVEVLKGECEGLRREVLAAQQEVARVREAGEASVKASKKEGEATAASLSSKLASLQQDALALREELAQHAQSKWEVEERKAWVESALAEKEKAWVEAQRVWEVKVMEAEGRVFASASQGERLAMSLKEDLTASVKRGVELEALLKAAEERARMAESEAASHIKLVAVAREEAGAAVARAEAAAAAAQSESLSAAAAASAAAAKLEAALSAAATDAAAAAVEAAEATKVAAAAAAAEATKLAAAAAEASRVAAAAAVAEATKVAAAQVLPPAPILPPLSIPTAPDAMMERMNRALGLLATSTTTSTANPLPTPFEAMSIAPAPSTTTTTTTSSSITSRPRLTGAGVAAAITTTKPAAIAAVISKAPLGAINPNTMAAAAAPVVEIQGKVIVGGKLSVSTPPRTCCSKVSQWAAKDFAAINKEGAVRGFYC